MHKPCPGIVRRFWWRTDQRARLAIGCLGVLSTLAITGAAGFGGDALPPERGSAGLEAAVHRGDSFEVTVHTVSDVDLFEGVEPATGLFFRARVAGLRRIADCWLAESRATARHLLRGKNVRLIVKRDGSAESDRITVDVRLSDGTDYARTIVHEGVAAADLSTRGELAPVESAARQERRGLWTTGCATGEATTTAASVPSSSAPDPATTTSAAVTTTESLPPPPPAPPAPPVTSTSPPPPDDAWVDARLGKVCLVEGARATSQDGNELVCARNDKNRLRWRRAE